METKLGQIIEGKVVGNIHDKKRNEGTQKINEESDK